jgi:hypothetical protein
MLHIPDNALHALREIVVVQGIPVYVSVTE